MQFIYRSSADREKITKKVILVGMTSAGRPQGRTYNMHGVDLGVKELSVAEAAKFQRQLPGQTTFEMGVFDPYESVYDDVRLLNPRRRPAPPHRSGRGTSLKTALIVEIMTGLTRRGGRLSVARGTGLF